MPQRGSKSCWCLSQVCWKMDLIWNVNITKARLFSLFGKIKGSRFDYFLFYCIFLCLPELGKHLIFHYCNLSLGPHFEFLILISVHDDFVTSTELTIQLGHNSSVDTTVHCVEVSSGGPLGVRWIEPNLFFGFCRRTCCTARTWKLPLNIARWAVD